MEENEQTHPLSHGDSIDDIIGDDIDDTIADAVANYLYHFCVDNIRNTINPFLTSGAPLVCLNEQNHPFLMGIADPARQTNGYAPYDKIETAFDWIDGIISGINNRKVLK